MHVISHILTMALRISNMFRECRNRFHDTSVTWYETFGIYIMITKHSVININLENKCSLNYSVLRIASTSTTLLVHVAYAVKSFFERVYSYLAVLEV